jgi:hypothetical protein
MLNGPLNPEILERIFFLQLSACPPMAREMLVPRALEGQNEALFCSLGANYKLGLCILQVINEL